MSTDQSACSPTEQNLLTDPCTSHWLRQAVHSSLERDPVDALRDAATLTKLLSERLDRLLAQARMPSLDANEPKASSRQPSFADVYLV